MKKTLIHHRALNNLGAFEAFRENSRRNSDFFHAAEGDLCWDTGDPENILLYMFHPGVSGAAPSRREVETGLKKKKLVAMHRLFETDPACRFVIELKNGTGRLEAALKALNSMIADFDIPHVVLDAFSADFLRLAKKHCPLARTSLHTKFVMGAKVLETAYQKPFVRLHDINDLEFVDIITISYNTSQANLLNRDIDHSFKQVLDAGKSLYLGAVKKPAQLNRILASRADGLYLRSRQVIDTLISSGKKHAV